MENDASDGLWFPALISERRRLLSGDFSSGKNARYNSSGAEGSGIILNLQIQWVLVILITNSRLKELDTKQRTK